ncbi:MAG: hypothetical protein LBF27_17785 [Sphingobacterium sp.]|jgi:phage gp46-like protein|nr:hypothetical protein [Sphingobacterium sp.]
MKRRIMIIWTALFRWIGKLYSSVRALLHVLFLQDAIVLKLVTDLLRIDSLPYWIGFARKRYAKRKFHDRKGALFTGNPGS